MMDSEHLVRNLLDNDKHLPKPVEEIESIFQEDILLFVFAH